MSFFKSSFKNKDGSWNHKNLVVHKNEIINTILENKQWFFIPYDFHIKKPDNEPKHYSRPVEKKDLLKLNIVLLIQFLNRLQTRHAKLIGVDISDLNIEVNT